MISINTFELDSTIWGPVYWSFLHHVAWSYPNTPNNITKRKYYDLIQNMPLFIPDTKIGDRFSKIIDSHPVTPYLDSRESFIKWVHFIHNKINLMLGKEEISFLASLDKFKAEYKPKPISISERIRMKKHYIYIAIFFFLLFLIYIFY